MIYLQSNYFKQTCYGRQTVAFSLTLADTLFAKVTVKVTDKQQVCV